MEQSMTTIETFIDSYANDISSLSHKLRQFVIDTAPGADEKLQAGWKSITYSHNKAFCSIMPHSNWVNLQFQAGAFLDDPMNRLQGTGNSMRHVKLSTETELDDSLADLVRLASELAR